MSERESAGDFEQLVLLSVLRLGDGAYGMTVRREIEEQGGRAVSLGAVYATLRRMERKGWISSRRADGSRERNSRAKRFFTVEAAGMSALKNALQTLDRMRDGLPGDAGLAGGLA